MRPFVGVSIPDLGRYNYLRRELIRGSFSLAEIFVVIALTGLISVPIVGQMGWLRSQARMAECVSNIKQIALLLNIYRVENMKYPRAALDDFRPIGSGSPDFGIFICPGTDDKVNSLSDLAGGSSYRYFGRTGIASWAMAVYGDGLIQTLDGDSDRGHGNDADGYDEDNPGHSTGTFYTSHPLAHWNPKSRYGAIYDSDYGHHDGRINLIHIKDGSWERIEKSGKFSE
jgi:hypothetical protein